MRIGFAYSNASRLHRQPIYGEQASRRVGYVEHDQRGIWFCNANGQRIARVIRYQPHQAPQPSASATGGSFVPSEYW